jgi:hypothetical protein
LPADASSDPDPVASGPPLPAIHTLWVGCALGPLERLCLTSWVRQGHEVVLHAYDDFPVPPGVRVVDAGLLCPRERIFRHRRTGSLAVFADLFRCLILARHDAIWLDADIVLVAPLPAARAFLAAERAPALGQLNNAVMRLPRDHRLLRELLALGESPVRALPWSRPSKLFGVIADAVRWRTFGPSVLPWGALGYVAIQRHVARHGFDGVILGPETCLTPDRHPLFTPVPDPDALLAPPALYLHLYRSHQTADLARPVPGSVYARLWELAGLEPGEG